MQDKPDLRNADDVEFVDIFCTEGLQGPQMTLTSAIRLGERPKIEDVRSKPRPLNIIKIILSSKEDKVSVLNHLKNLKEASEPYKKVCVSHSYSKTTREQNKRKIDDARSKDSENADNYLYCIRGPADKLEVQRR